MGNCRSERDGEAHRFIQSYGNQSKSKDFIIPLLPLETQQKIASLVQQSHEARKKAKELLEVAKRAVEIAIEKNEKEAIDHTQIKTPNSLL